MERNLVKKVIDNGGSIQPLIIPSEHTKGTGLMNPSVYNDDGRLVVNVRHINYTLYHCEGEQFYSNRWGPLMYMHPENDVHLKTNNIFCHLRDDLTIEQWKQIDTSLLDVEPMWEFHGLEDARVVRWDKKLYVIGVRRDTTPNGVGRMELSEIRMDSSTMREIRRTRIDPPGEPSYCEKNWMPVEDMPYHFVKWSNPTQVVKANLKDGTSETIHLSEYTIPALPDFRGGSQVIRWGDYRVACVHQVNLFTNRLKQKDGLYMHRFIIWDLDWNIVHITEPFSFLHANIEFCAGMTLWQGDLLLSFGFQDNAAYLLRVPAKMIEEVFGITQIMRRQTFDWGKIKDNPTFYTNLIYEIFITDVYQKLFKIKEGDIVVDIGASVGPFAYKAMERNPGHVYCIEPQKDMFAIMQKNLSSFPNVTCINKGIAAENGKITFEYMLSPEEGEMWKQEEGDGISFKSFIEQYGITHIDFLKVDCEGGEYDIFNEENLQWIKANVRRIVVEVHRLSPDQWDKFIQFRNLYLREFLHYRILAYDQEPIDENVWDDSFTDKWGYFTIYIDNR